ncbi:MAG TPA: hypothetical protein VGO01_24270 [Bradyrhizobium sp.]|jgi:hypothetical protein|nr:hypothetical protein [Bradyrhizobium sp.]
MLPGFRFLFVAVVLSTSMLIFGLGAAALLRAAHEEFASIPSRRAPPETLFAQRDDAGPTLALVRIEPSAADEKAAMATALSDSVPDQTAIVSAPPEPEESARESDKQSDKIATLIDAAMPARDSLLSEAPNPEASTFEIPVQAETPAQTGTPSPAAETQLAAIAEVTPIAPNQVTAPDQEAALVDDSTRIAETRIATLGGPPVTIETQTPSKIAPAVVKKSAQARRVVKRRRIAPPARVTQQAPQTPADPFARPFGR